MLENTAVTVSPHGQQESVYFSPLCSSSEVEPVLVLVVFLSTENNAPRRFGVVLLLVNDCIYNIKELSFITRQVLKSIACTSDLNLWLVFIKFFHVLFILTQRAQIYFSNLLFLQRWIWKILCSTGSHLPNIITIFHLLKLLWFAGTFPSWEHTAHHLTQFQSLKLQWIILMLLLGLRL